MVKTLSDLEVRNATFAINGMVNDPSGELKGLKNRKELDFKFRYSLERLVDKFKVTTESTETAVKSFDEERFKPLREKMAVLQEAFKAEDVTEEKKAELNKEMEQLAKDYDGAVTEITNTLSNTYQDYDIHPIKFSDIESFKLSDVEFKYIKPVVEEVEVE